MATIDKAGTADALIDRVRLQFGRLNVTPDDLEGRDQRSSLFKTMFLAFSAGGAKDWTSNLQISLDHSGAQHRLQFHHFFPKALLTRHGFSPRDADDIANLTFISGRTNRKISDKAPSVYLADILAKQGTGLMALQGIPSEAALLDVGSYRDFLNERRQLLATMLNDFLGTNENAGS